MTDDRTGQTVVAGPAPEAVAVPPIPVGTSDRKVLLIGIDGLRWDRIAAADAPILRHLIATGTYATGMHDRDSPARTESGPGWSTLATGTSPAQHGVRRNSFRGHRYDRHPDFITLAKRRRPGLIGVVVVDWAPLIAHGTFGPAIDLRVRFDGERHGFFAEDVRIADFAAQLLAEQSPDTAFVYFGGVDEAGHQTGPLSATYRHRLEAVDAMVGRLLGAVRGRITYADENWLILVTTDHGHRDSGGHGRKSEAERAIFVIANGPEIAARVRRSGFRSVDIAPTVLDHLGVVPDPAWSFEGRTLLAEKAE
jgi:predicted AlkP superfamily pyrophosphatase or phosphodiesterase